MTQENKPKNLFEKLHRVMGLIGNVPKNGYNTGQKYKFVSESDVMDKAREAALLERVLLIPSEIGHMVERGKYQNGGEFFLTTVEIEIEAIDIDNPSDRYKWKMIGQGADPQDKGSNKAITGAVKYGLLKPFLTGTGDDAEHDAKPDHDYSPAQARKPATKDHVRPQEHYSAPIKSSPEMIGDSPPPHSDDDVPAWMRDEEPPMVMDAMPADRTYHYKPPYNLKDTAKQYGCRWNKDLKTWDSKVQIPEFDAYIK